MALDVPVIPLYQPPDIVAFRATIRKSGQPPVTSSGTRRTGGSATSPGRGDRRLAPRGLGSGRRGHAADAEARRHGRSWPRLHPSRACLNPFDARCVAGTSQISALRISQPRARGRRSSVTPDSHVAASARLERRLLDESRRFTLTYRIRPGLAGATGCRSRAADFVFTHRALFEARREGTTSIEREVR